MGTTNLTNRTNLKTGSKAKRKATTDHPARLSRNQREQKDAQQEDVWQEDDETSRPTASSSSCQTFLANSIGDAGLTVWKSSRPAKKRNVSSTDFTEGHRSDEEKVVGNQQASSPSSRLGLLSVSSVKSVVVFAFRIRPPPDRLPLQIRAIREIRDSPLGLPFVPFVPFEYFVVPTLPNDHRLAASKWSDAFVESRPLPARVLPACLPSV